MNAKLKPREIPDEIKQAAEYLWTSVRGLVQVNREDEPKVLSRIAGCLMMLMVAEDMSKQVTQSPVYKSLISRQREELENLALAQSPAKIIGAQE